jgi:hypothetical protein
MHGFQPGTVRRLVQFMYTGDYNEHEDNNAAPDQNAGVGNSDEVEEGKTVDYIGNVVSELKVL